jgi:hypothetical protein
LLPLSVNGDTARALSRSTALGTQPDTSWGTTARGHDVRAERIKFTGRSLIRHVFDELSETQIRFRCKYRCCIINMLECDSGSSNKPPSKASKVCPNCAVPEDRLNFIRAGTKAAIHAVQKYDREPGRAGELTFAAVKPLVR